MVLEIGSRVAYVIAGDARLAVLTKLDGDQAFIKFDTRKTTLVDVDRLHRVDYWKDRASAIEFTRLRALDDNLPLLDIFKRRTAITFGTAALRAMWYYGNHYVFGGHLKEPQFVVTTSKANYGRYSSSRVQKRGTLQASAARNHSSLELFGTTLHEMVHQQNFEHDKYNGTYDSAEGTHGSAFKRWIPLIKEKTGITITITGDVNDDDAEFINNQDEASTQPFIFALLHFNSGWKGFILKSRSDLDIFAGTARQLLITNNADDRKIYAGISTLTRVRRELYNAKGGNLTIQRAKTNISPAVVQLLKNTAKPIIGYMLPEA